MKNNPENLDFSQTKTSVSIIVPCRNEVEYIDDFLRSVLSQKITRKFEILIADGISDDGTSEKLLNWCEKDDRICVVNNKLKTVSYGLNKAIKVARNDIIIRMDVHTIYDINYIEACVNALEKTNAQNVGGAARTKSNTYFQKANSLAYHSKFSVGGSMFHNINYEGFVDTVPYGCWYKNYLEKIGLFDEELVRNQDDELNLRITLSGGKIWQSSQIKSWYFPRSSLKSLFSQYMQYGYWKVRVMQKHKLATSIRHFVPGIFVFSVLMLLLGSIFSSVLLNILLLLLLTYFVAILIASIMSTIGNWKYIFIMPLIFLSYHIGYGYGFNRGVFDFILLNRKANNKFKKLTRNNLNE